MPSASPSAIEHGHHERDRDQRKETINGKVIRVKIRKADS